MTVADQSDVHLDLRSALYTATSLRTTIRHADSKARIMLGLLGGSVVVVLQQAPTLGRCDSAPLLTATAVAAVVWLAALAAGGWHLLAANRRRVDFAAHPVKIRLARILWEIAAAYGYRDRDGIVVDIHLTQDELATMCGAAEITLQKALRDLRTAGIVATGYRRMLVRDAAALQECADTPDVGRPRASPGPPHPNPDASDLRFGW